MNDEGGPLNAEPSLIEIAAVGALRGLALVKLAGSAQIISETQ